MRSLNIKPWHWTAFFIIAGFLVYFLPEFFAKTTVLFGSLALFSGIQLREVNMTTEMSKTPYYWQNFLNAVYGFIFMPSVFLFALSVQAFLYSR